jgi:hypothetical protein
VQYTEWFDAGPCIDLLTGAAKTCIPEGCSGAACRGGAKLQTFNVTTEAAFGGTFCPVNQFRVVTCGTSPCGKPDFFLNCSFQCNK